MEGSGQPPERGSGDPSQHMPPPSSSEQPTAANVPPPADAPPPPPPPGGPPHGYSVPQGFTNWPAGARLTVPGNAEWALWFCVEIVFAIIWAASDQVGASEFVIASAIITFAYLISRGIAKASRVLEQ
jgi:hypothetical protein